MKRILSLFLLLFLTFSALGFADEKTGKEEKDKKSIAEYKRNLADCLDFTLEDVYYEDLEPYFKQLRMSSMYEKAKHKLSIMEIDSEYKKEHMKCYKTLKRVQAELEKLLKKD